MEGQEPESQHMYRICVIQTETFQVNQIWKMHIWAPHFVWEYSNMHETIKFGIKEIMQR